MPKRRRDSSQVIIPTADDLAAFATKAIDIPSTIRSVLGPGASAQYLPGYLISRGIRRDGLPPGLIAAYRRIGGASRAGREANGGSRHGKIDTAAPLTSAEDDDIIARIVVSPLDNGRDEASNSKYPAMPDNRCNESLEAIVDESIRHLVRSKAANSQTVVDDGSYGRNILSMGYVPAKEGHDGGSVPNMASGVYCVHPNSTATYARTSSFMRCVHKLVGDSILKDMLTTCIVLIPAGDAGGTMQRGNYFQLCGPPLTFYKPVQEKEENQSVDDEGVGLGGEDNMIESDLACSSPKTKRVKFNESVKCTVFDNGQEDLQMKMPRNPYLKATLKKSATCSNDEANADAKSAESAGEDGGDNSETDNANHAEIWDPKAPIPRHLMFYSESFVKHPGLPPSHVLNIPDDCQSFGGVAERLLDSMVRLRVPSSTITSCGGKKKRSKKRPKRWKRLRESGIVICIDIRRRHQQCNYARLLDRHCPLPSSDYESCEASDDTPSLADLSASFVTGDQVASFICSCLWSAFPTSFWGSRANFDVISSTATRFIKLRRREQMSKGELMKGVKVTDVKWLFGDRTTKNSISRSDHEAGTRLLQNVVHWLYCSYIIPLIRSCFYATETEFTANRVVFYRKPVWTQFRTLAMASLKGRQYTEIEIAEAARRNADQDMGCSKLRLLPKATGVRVLNLLSHAQRVDFGDESAGHARPSLCRPSAEDRRISTNSTLRRTFAVLKHEHGNSPSSFGCGVFGLNEVFPLLLNFKKDLRKFRKQTKNNAPLHFASVDLHRCYDNIDQNYLYDLVKRVITNEEYLIQQHNVLHPFQSLERIQRKRSTHLCDPVDIQNFPDLASHELAGSYSQSIFVDGITTSLVKKDEVLGLLKEHIFSNLVAINGDFGPRFLSQSSGIPQGSVLSTMLCNYYYGDLESRLLGGVFERDERSPQSRGVNLLVRIVDDFLLVSTRKDVCVQFLRKMQEGIPELGVRINQAKTMTNFEYNVSPSVASDQKRAVGICSNGNEFFAWCGMLFNTKTCEARVDYSRFAGSLAVDGLTADRLGEHGTKLTFRIKSFVRPRCQALLFDLRLNTVENAFLNFYQAMLLGAVKTVGYIRTGLNGGVKHNPKFVVGCIEDVISYAQALISSRLKATAAPTTPQDKYHDESDVSSRHLSLPAAQWLGRHAFRAILKTIDPCHGFGDVLFCLSESKEDSKRDSVSCNYALLCKVANRALGEFDLSRFEY